MQATAIFKCLSDHKRLTIALLIAAEQELCVCEVTEALQLPQPKISQLLASLKKAQILIGERDGQWIYYRIDPKLPTWALELLTNLANSYPTLVQAPLNRLQQMGCRPQRKQVCCPS